MSRKRTKSICLRLSPEEHEVLCLKAEDAGMSVSALLRDHLGKARIFNHRQQQRWFAVLLSLRKHLTAMAQAFAYAVESTPSVQHSGTVSVQGVAYRPTGSDGPSAGAAMAVGFIAMFKGEHIQRGVALTGTVEPDGQIGPVGSIPDKIRAAAREGYRTVLVPRGQIHDARWNLNELAFQLNVTVKEVDTIDEAYQLMTGQRI